MKLQTIRLGDSVMVRYNGLYIGMFKDSTPLVRILHIIKQSKAA